jgi:hypothetical protein
LYFCEAWLLLDAQKQHWLTPTGQYVAFRYYRYELVNPVGLARRYNQRNGFEVRFLSQHPGSEARMLSILLDG